MLCGSKKCFLYSEPAQWTNHASLKTADQSASALLGVQLQALINWMLRFHAGNPRELHHLRSRGVQWRHQRLQQMRKAPEECCYRSSASWQNSSTALYPESPVFLINLAIVNNRYSDEYFPFPPSQYVFTQRSPHASSSYWTKAGQMSAHSTAPGAEGLFGRFIVQCALTFGG